MSRTYPAFMCLSQFVVGAIRLFRARPLSLRYNVWTTRFRERHPQINLSPTPVWRERNTEIITLLFRFFGAAFLFLSFLWLNVALNSR